MAKYYGFIDCEFTSGYAPRLQSVELIALGCVIIDSEEREVARYERLVRPTKKSNQKLTRRIRELTQLTQEQINQAPPFSEFVCEFESELARYDQEFGHDIQWWSWGDYDQVALKQTILVNHYEGRFVHFVDHIQDLQPQVIPSLFAKIGIKKHQLSLANSKRIFGLGETIEHQALADALDLKAVFLAFRHHEPNWELVETFRPKPLQPVHCEVQTTTEVRHIPAAGPNATIYGLFKQLWQISPPQAMPPIEWQHRRCLIAGVEAILIRELQMQWLVVNQTQVCVIIWHGQTTVICSHSFHQTKQNQKLFAELLTALTQLETENQQNVNQEGRK